MSNRGVLNPKFIILIVSVLQYMPEREEGLDRSDSHQTTVRNRRNVLKAIGSVGSISALAGCSGTIGGQGGSGGPITAGVAVPTSGGYAALGDAIIAGTEAAIEDRDGSINGREIEVVSKDTQASPSAARNAVEQLVSQDGADFINGPVSTAVGEALLPIIEENEVLTIMSNAATTAAVTDKCNRYTFKTSPINEQQAMPMAQWAAENLDGDAITFSADYSAGAQVNQFFKNYFEEGGGTVVGDLYAPLDETDFSSYFSRIQNSDADIVFSFFAGGAAVRYLNQAADFGLGQDHELTGLGYLTTGDVLPAIGENANGWKTCLDYADTLEREEFQTFRSTMSDQGVSEPNLYHARGYAAAQSVFKAMDESGSTNTEDVISGLEGLEVAAPHGDIKYRAGDHQAILDFYIREVQDQQNEILDTHENVILEDRCEAF
jgi:branched-chain amino acid transport system substrate-binding protein